MRLESAQNALRSPPSGKRKGQATNPGFSFRVGLSARQATSVPETTDWRRKLATSAASGPSLNRGPFDGSKRKLAQVAPATAASPTGRSAGPHPEIMSQKVRRSAARVAAGPARPGEASSAGVLNRPVQHAKPTQCAGARTSAQGNACWKSCPVHRWSGLAFDTSIRVVRRELPCSTQRGKHGRAANPRSEAQNAMFGRGWNSSARGFSFRSVPKPRRVVNRIRPLTGFEIL